MAAEVLGISRCCVTDQPLQSHRSCVTDLLQISRGFMGLVGRPGFDPGTLGHDPSDPGDYRVIYEFHDQEVLVLVLRMGHRREVYDRCAPHHVE